MPAVVIRPIWLPASASVNQSAPSGPDADPDGPLPGVGSGYVVTAPAVVTRPMTSVPGSVYQSAPSGPAAMPDGRLNGNPTPIALNAPPVVIRSIAPLAGSVTHSAPSGPAAMSSGRAPAEELADRARRRDPPDLATASELAGLR